MFLAFAKLLVLISFHELIKFFSQLGFSQFDVVSLDVELSLSCSSYFTCLSTLSFLRSLLPVLRPSLSP